MKFTKRAIAMLLTVLMLLGVAPLGVFAAESANTEAATEEGTLAPIADTFVSVTYPDAVYGASETLTVNNQNFYVASFNAAGLGDSNAVTLHLPMEGSASQGLSVYLIDDYTIDEATLCYSNLPTLTGEMLVGEYTVLAGDNALNLRDLTSRVSGETFTVVAVGGANSLVLDFEGYKDGDVIQTPYTARTVKSYRVKYSKATDEKISSTYEATSAYRSRDKIIARVEPAPTEPPATEAPTESTEEAND